MTAPEHAWANPLELDVRFGYLGRDTWAPRQHHPQVVLNNSGESVLRTLRRELADCSSFLFSVAFVSPRAVALLKQELREFGERGTGRGSIVTSDYLGFNSPAAFSELLNLAHLGIDVRIHETEAFHPKGYIFNNALGVTAMVGSSNLTENALVRNHEWNLKVSAAPASDLAGQFAALTAAQLSESAPLTQAWITDYSARYVAPPRRARRRQSPSAADPTITGPTVPQTTTAEPTPQIQPNRMQQVALEQIAAVRAAGERRALVISATGTGKTILSALDVRAANPRRLLFVVHREQVIDRTMAEYQRVLGGPDADFGKLSGSSKQAQARYLFATVQTLAQPDLLRTFPRDAFDYIIVDEAHRSAAAQHQRVLTHFTPEFLLGMTATPERTDGENIYEFYDYNVPYEIRLKHALEEEMLAPFHYYGVADITLSNGHVIAADADLSVLASAERVDHLLHALQIYGQASTAPRGLIFCSRRDEAQRLSDALNCRSLRERPLRTVALTGTDSIARRESVVQQLEDGELDYVLTVDIFNEGVDIPSVNQIVMLRQTQSAIVFVQQLGRGLRTAPGKDYVVVIDFIGNYANNYLIPIALFGDESLNKESLRQQLISAEESGVLPDLSSVRFDRISQARVLKSISDTRLDSMQNLKASLVAMRNRLGKVPALMDFVRFESTDPVLLATKARHYPDLVAKILHEGFRMSDGEDAALAFLSHEILPAKRGHEFVVLRQLLRHGRCSITSLHDALRESGLPSTSRHVDGVVESFTMANHAQKDLKKYGQPIAVRHSDAVTLRSDIREAYQAAGDFARFVDDLIGTGSHLVFERFRPDAAFTPGRQYSRKEATRQLNWPRKWESTIYGYKSDADRTACPIFVTLHKSDEVSASTAYEDALLDAQTMQWMSKSNRSLSSPLESSIARNEIPLHVFVKKNDAEGSDFYYLGSPQVVEAVETTMPGNDGRALAVVKMRLKFDEPIEAGLYDYFHPVLT